MVLVAQFSWTNQPFRNLGALSGRGLVADPWSMATLVVALCHDIRSRFERRDFLCVWPLSISARAVARAVCRRGGCGISEPLQGAPLSLAVACFQCIRVCRRHRELAGLRIPRAQPGRL